MSTKRDPLAIVINYFTTAALGDAAQALTVVKEIVRSRQPVTASVSAAKRKPGLPHRKRPTPTPLPLDGGLGAPTN